MFNFVRKLFLKPFYRGFRLLIVNFLRYLKALNYKPELFDETDKYKFKTRLPERQGKSYYPASSGSENKFAGNSLENFLSFSNLWRFSEGFFFVFFLFNFQPAIINLNSGSRKRYWQIFFIILRKIITKFGFFFFLFLINLVLNGGNSSSARRVHATVARASHSGQNKRIWVRNWKFCYDLYSRLIEINRSNG